MWLKPAAAMKKQGGFSEKQGPTLILQGPTLFFRGGRPAGFRFTPLQACGHRPAPAPPHLYSPVKSALPERRMGAACDKSEYSRSIIRAESLTLRATSGTRMTARLVLRNVTVYVSTRKNQALQQCPAQGPAG